MLDVSFSKLSAAAPGCRGAGEGVLWYVGDYGYGWSSTFHDSGDHYRGIYLRFHTTICSSSAAAGRASGLPLRCLSE
ncbi:hypothetical protein [uncultured Rikenella sp.]|uniref:hypothetical protein n=1 Tax=uncultured Rikenella sp. TaxID=368003 RepID=UPI0026076639|nr:hypothetical protein [uncultured Rikenella sp.]